MIEEIPADCFFVGQYCHSALIDGCINGEVMVICSREKIGSDKTNEKHADCAMVMHDRKIIEIMSRVIRKCQNDEDYTIIDNFQTNYASRLFVV